ncbi:CopM family metallochaperone [Polymorphum gilvum]|uniref:Protein of hypothetical function DUF305 n=1 Tax=Polymorphum gilvum (strain LMG 25793 / CGMCC 1.9160 / SL003B-26A1) TaxID=991905 RepID=F2IXW2_POLGS|nr:DUF305 domain-containing protein [Polymorphum gilvum]ADZ69443.1 Protein of hypothetical function DUF305 [Polymorphum gilvum SL003B-26A1]
MAIKTKLTAAFAGVTMMAALTTSGWSDEAKVPQPTPKAAHEGHAMETHGGSDTAATAAFREANARMHGGMEIEFTGDADIDFVRGMIAHHQGAIDMARIVMEYGTDPEIRKLAEDIVKAQDSEIAFMKDWLAKRGM